MADIGAFQRLQSGLYVPPMLHLSPGYPCASTCGCNPCVSRGCLAAAGCIDNVTPCEYEVVISGISSGESCSDCSEANRTYIVSHGVDDPPVQCTLDASVPLGEPCTGYSAVCSLNWSRNFRFIDPEFEFFIELSVTLSVSFGFSRFIKEYNIDPDEYINKDCFDITDEEISLDDSGDLICSHGSATCWVTAI